MHPFFFTYTCKHVHSKLIVAPSLLIFLFLSVFRSQSVGMGSQPIGIDCGKDGLTVVACIKEVSVYS